MGDFDRDTNYNKNAGINSVKIGYKKPILDTEFNEMQAIGRQRLAKLVSNHFGDGIHGIGTTSYASSKFTISNEIAIVSGELIDISSLSLTVSEGESIYLDTYDMEVSYLSTLFTQGNQQETIYQTNYLVDSDVGVETSRRVVLAFTLSKTNVTSGHKYLLLGKIQGGVFVKSASTIFTQLNLGKTQPTKGWWFKEL